MKCSCVYVKACVVFTALWCLSQRQLDTNSRPWGGGMDTKQQVPGFDLINSFSFRFSEYSTSFCSRGYSQRGIKIDKGKMAGNLRNKNM